MCYFNQLGLPALIIHQVGELGRPAGREREGQGVPVMEGFWKKRKQKGEKEGEEEKKETEMKMEIRATSSVLVSVSCVYKCV